MDVITPDTTNLCSSHSDIFYSCVTKEDCIREDELTEPRDVIDQLSQYALAEEAECPEIENGICCYEDDQLNQGGRFDEAYVPIAADLGGRYDSNDVTEAPSLADLTCQAEKTAIDLTEEIFGFDPCKCELRLIGKGDRKRCRCIKPRCYDVIYNPNGSCKSENRCLNLLVIRK